MNLLDINLYKEDIKKVSQLNLSWNMLNNKSILITGATGMIGSFLIDLLMYMNKSNNLNCNIHAISRNINVAKKRFEPYWESNLFNYYESDINQQVSLNVDKIDIVIHTASNTHPIAYATKPIETIITNIIGTRNLLEFASNKNVEKFIFISTVEIYGENRRDTDKFSENYCGYIDCNTLRAGYPESKRAGEALCQAYIKEKGLNIVIPRLSRVFGPTMLMTDTKAISQFIINAVENKNIVLKSNGEQLYSYSYVADAVIGILLCIFKGENGEAYNISSDNYDIRLKDLATIIAKSLEKEVIFDIPTSTEAEGYSKATKATIDNSKLKSLGMNSLYTINESIERTIKILKQLYRGE